MPASEVINALKARFDDLEASEFRGQSRVVVPRGAFLEVMRHLRDEQRFDFLVDVTCVDYLRYRNATDRFGLVYILGRTRDNCRLTIRVMLNEPDLSVPSITSLWEGANWLEREVYDLFGITFADHPDLRRIVLPEEFTAHPLRKDYPMQGRGERHNFPVLKRGEY